MAGADSFLKLGSLAVHYYEDVAGLGNLHAVSGPVTTGGLGSLVRNLARIDWTVNRLTSLEENFHVFNPCFWEPRLGELQKKWMREHPGEAYCERLIRDFYWQVFESGLIVDARLLPDWGTSTGATMEKKYLEKLRIPLIRLSPAFFAGMPAF